MRRSLEVGNVGTSQSPEVRNNGIEIIDISNIFGQGRLRNALIVSSGNAAVIVHPFFVEARMQGKYINAERKAMHDRYLKRLTHSVGNYAGLGLPLIVFEEVRRMQSFEQTLSKMRLESGQVYVVPTCMAEPTPENESLEEFSKKLNGLGLQKAVVAGAYLWLDDSTLEESSFVQDLGAKIENVPTLLKKYRLSGCVGDVLNSFSRNDIYAVPAAASYPRKSYIESGAASYNW